MRIKISSNYLTYNELLATLKNVNKHEDLEIASTNKRRLRDGDPAIVIALVTVTGAALNLLLQGIVDILKEGDDRKIVVKRKDGTTIEMTGNYPIDMVDPVIEKLKALDDQNEVEEIKILRP